MPRGGGLKKIKVKVKKRKNDTVADIFGTKPISPPEMMKALWAWIKKHKLMSKDGDDNDTEVKTKKKKKQYDDDCD